MRNVYDSDIELKLKSNQLPAILSEDTSVKTDIWGFIQKTPDNLFWAFIDPTAVDVDDLGRLIEKALRRYYQPGLTIARWVNFARPRRREGIKNLQKMDLDSFTYIEPVLYRADAITLDLLEPLFSTPEKDKKTAGDKALDFGIALQNLSKNFESRGASADNQVAYNEIINELYDTQMGMREHIQKLSDAVDEVLSEIDTIPVLAKQKNLKRERVRALRKHLLRIKKQGLDLYDHMEKASKDLQSLGQSREFTAKEMAVKIQDIGFTLNARVRSAQLLSLEIADMSFARRRRKIRTRIKGKVSPSDESLMENASIEHYRRLKLSIDVCFVPDAPQMLGVMESKALDDNAENYFIMAVEYALNNAFDKDGTYIPFGKRGVRYGEDLAQHIAQLYALGKPEDALYAVQLLKMAEGRESHQVFPHAFQDMVKKQLISQYGVNEKTVENDSHAKVFLERVREISMARNHSPMVYGPRDTEKQYFERMRKFIYGRMYPGSQKFIAVPLSNEFVRHPLIKMRSNMLAYVTGGRVVKLEELKRKATPGNALEKELDLAIKHKWFLWEKKQEKTAENPYPLSFFERAPVWFNIPRRAALMASVPASALLLTGLVAAPMTVVVPVAALGGVAAVNYSIKALKATWALPFVHKPVKFALRTAAITAAVGGAGYLLLPLTPAIGGWALTTALAHPLWAAKLALPFIGLAAIKTYTVAKKAKTEDRTPVPFAEYRKIAQIEEEPMREYDFSSPISQPAPVVLEVKDAEKEAAPTMSADALIAEFMQRMGERDESFFARMSEIFAKARGPVAEESPSSSTEDAYSII